MFGIKPISPALIRTRLMQRTPNYKLLLFLSICFFTYLLWAMVIPYNEAPDEYMRMDLVRFMVTHHALPHGANPEIRNPLWGFSYAFFPYLSQIFSSGCVWFCARFLHFSPASWYIAARLPGVVYATLTAWFLVKIGDKLFYKNFKWPFVIMVAFLPQFIFLSAYVNNESLALLTVCAIMYHWLQGMENGWRIKSCVWLSVWLSVCLLSYYNAYGFVLLSVPFFIVTFLSHEKKRGVGVKERCQGLAKKSLIIIGLVLLMAGWWFVRNWCLYQGDIWGFRAVNEVGERYAREDLKPSVRRLRQSFSFSEMLWDMHWVKITIQSFFGVFGSMSIPLSDRLYRVYHAVVVVGLGLNVFGVRRRRSEKKLVPLFMVCVSVASGISLALSLYNSYTSDFQPQGRYVIYLIIPIALLVAKGIEHMSLFVVRKPGMQRWASPLFCGAYMALSYFCFLRYIVPTYLQGG